MNKNQTYKPIVLLIISLLIIFPISISYIIAQADAGTKTANQAEITGLPINEETGEFYYADSGPGSSVGKQCENKQESVSSFVEFMDNEIIVSLEKVASILFLISTVMSALDTVINTVYMGLGCCFPNVFNEVICIAKEGSGKVWGNWFSNVIKPLTCIVSCGWCLGADEAGGESCWGIKGQIGLGKIGPSVKQADGTSVAGIGQFHLSPYENIYTALGCMCPIAILFNLRKLKTIYQVNSCCIEQACSNGFSTESCDQQLAEATCMYWEGSLIKSMIKVILSYINSVIVDLLAETMAKEAIGAVLYCALAVWNLAHVEDTINGVKSSNDWMRTTFNEPNCNDLGFDKIKAELRTGDTSETGILSGLTFNDFNRDGKYDGFTKSHDARTITANELPESLKNDPEVKGGNYIKHIYNTKDGPRTFYEVSLKTETSGKGAGFLLAEKKAAKKQPKSTIKPGLYEVKVDGSKGDVILKSDKGYDNKVNELKKTSNLAFQNTRFYSNNRIMIGDDSYAYTIENQKVILTDLNGETTTTTLKTLEGKTIVYAGINAEVTKVKDDGTLVLDDKREITFGTTSAEGVQEINVKEGDKIIKTLQYGKEGIVAVENGEGYIINGVAFEKLKQKDIRGAAEIITTEGDALEGATNIAYKPGELSYVAEDKSSISVVEGSKTVEVKSPELTNAEMRFNTINENLNQLIEIRSILPKYVQEPDNKGTWRLQDDGKTYYFYTADGQKLSSLTGKFTDKENNVFETNNAAIKEFKKTEISRFSEDGESWRDKNLVKDAQVDAAVQLGYAQILLDAAKKDNPIGEKSHKTQTRTKIISGVTASTETDLYTGISTTTLNKDGLTVQTSQEIIAEINIKEIKEIKSGEIGGVNTKTIVLNDKSEVRVVGTTAENSATFVDKEGKLQKEITYRASETGCVIVILDYSSGKPKRLVIYTSGIGENKIVLQSKGEKGAENNVITISQGGVSIKTTLGQLKKNNLPYDGEKEIKNTLKAVLALGGKVEDVKFEQTASGGLYSTGDIMKNGKDFIITEDGRTIQSNWKNGNEVREIYTDGNNQELTEFSYEKDGSQILETTTSINGKLSIREISTFSKDLLDVETVTIEYKGDKIEVSIEILEGTNEPVTHKITYNKDTKRFEDLLGNAKDLNEYDPEVKKRLEQTQSKIEKDTKKQNQQKYKNNQGIGNFLGEPLFRYQVIDETKAKNNQKKALYDATWIVLDEILGKYAYEYIDDQCKDGSIFLN